MKKRSLGNFIMIAIILVIVAAGIFTVGYIRGWFNKAEGSAVLQNMRGVVNLQRNGVSTKVQVDTVLRAGDQLTCESGATATITIGSDHLVLGDNAQLTILDPALGSFRAEISHGSVFASCQNAPVLEFAGNSVSFQSATALLSIRDGTQSISVFRGTVGNAKAGQVLHYHTQTVEPMTLNDLNDFAISQLKSHQSESLCYTTADLDQLKQERQQAIQALINSQTQLSNTAGQCTVAIYCDTILDNTEDLDPAKAGFVPEDGEILHPVTVRFAEGETAFDALKRVCDITGIQLEYSWTPLYDSYYVEGIHQLYEFDCGYESGWMYMVNDQAPNYGSSSYILRDGDIVVWAYTCKGLGADLGVSVE